MSKKYIIYITMALCLVIGSGFLFSSWIFPPKVVEAQCTQVYLSGSETNPPSCPGGVRISSTQSAIQDLASDSRLYYMSLCIQ